jgi:small subunit ribosomal protein S20
VATSLSSKKRIRQNEKRRSRNRVRRSRIKTLRRKFREAVTAGEPEQADAELRKTCKLVDQVAAKGVMHKNTAARIKSRLQKRLNKLQTAKA